MLFLIDYENVGCAGKNALDFYIASRLGELYYLIALEMVL